VAVRVVPRGVGENPAVLDGLAVAEWDGVGVAVEAPVVEDAAGEDPAVEDPAVEDAVVEDPVVEDAAVGRGVAGAWCRDPLAVLSVATESIAPATRQTARMLASSGMMVPLPRSGAASRRSRLRRRLARSSRW
jgi:hypothetical protein